MTGTSRSNTCGGGEQSATLRDRDITSFAPWFYVGLRLQRTHAELEDKGRGDWEVQNFNLGRMFAHEQILLV